VIRHLTPIHLGPGRVLPAPSLQSRTPRGREWSSDVRIRMRAAPCAVRPMSERRPGCVTLPSLSTATLTWSRRLIVAGVVVALLVTLALLTVPPFRHAVQTAALLPEILDFGVRPLSALTPEPRRIRTTYGDPGDRMDIYLPADAGGDAPTPALLLVLGVHPLPLDHPVVIRVSKAIARLGVGVGIPESSELREHRITPHEPARMAEAFMALADREELAGGTVGMTGFSAGASLALVAATDRRIAGRVAYVNAFGGYADARMLLADIMTRTMVVDGHVMPWQPDEAARVGLLDTLLWPLSSHAERERLRVEALAILLAEPRPTDAHDPAFAATLGDEARAIYELVTAPSREVAEAVIEQAPAATRQHLDSVSPSARAEDVRAQVFLMHDVDDPAIPVSHVHALADMLPEGMLRRTTVFELFHHVQPGEELGLAELPELWGLFVHLHELVGVATS
jgi:hypothetical protein